MIFSINRPGIIMKLLILILITLILFSCDFIKDSSVKTPPDILWTRTFGGGCGNSVQQTTDGGYIFIRSSGSYGPPSIVC